MGDTKVVLRTQCVTVGIICHRTL